MLEASVARGVRYQLATEQSEDYLERHTSAQSEPLPVAVQLAHSRHLTATWGHEANLAEGSRTLALS